MTSANERTAYIATDSISCKHCIQVLDVLAEVTVCNNAVQTFKKQDQRTPKELGKAQVARCPQTAEHRQVTITAVTQWAPSCHCVRRSCTCDGLLFRQKTLSACTKLPVHVTGAYGCVCGPCESSAVVLALQCTGL